MLNVFNSSDHPHRRLNLLTGEWVLVSPHRSKRPWQGQVEKAAADERLQYDPECYLCPGNERAGGVANPKYTGTFVFQNDFSALLPDVPEGRSDEHEQPHAQFPCLHGPPRVSLKLDSIAPREAGHESPEPRRRTISE